ncbi:MAG: hypothetical protein DHS20C05_13000 [Hyphococcus sp.]|nr:MAG: hypothetical protein DHS20C05_13000 [Marinicaulis sp.]
MTPRLIGLITIIGFTASAACAEDSDFAVIDTDGSGSLSLTEVQTAAPQVTAEEFITYDVDSSGELSAEEFSVWQEAAKMKAE